jgi:rhodanese-related sulfurtransferase
VIQNLTAQQASDLIQRGNVDVVDVREPHEWAAGHIAGSRLVPLGMFRASSKSALPRDGVLFVCAAGMRSQTAARIAASSGLTQVYNLTGGTRSWTAAGLPLVLDDISVAV